MGLVLRRELRLCSFVAFHVECEMFAAFLHQKFIENLLRARVETEDVHNLFHHRVYVLITGKKLNQLSHKQISNQRQETTV